MTHLAALPDAVAPAHIEHASIIDAAVEWCAATSRPAEPDLFALLCAGAAGSDGSGSQTSWTRERVFHLLRCDIPHWSSRNGVRWPVEIVEAMWTWFGFLAATGRLDADSDPVWELRKPLICYGGLDLRGRLRSEDDGGEQLIPCECFMPYRRTVELLRQLLEGATSTAELCAELDPGGDLRRARRRRERARTPWLADVEPWVLLDEPDAVAAPRRAASRRRRRPPSRGPAGRRA